MNKLEIIKSKIFTTESIQSLLAVWRFKGEKIVFTNGCFDLLHLGHIDYLSKAADQGDILIIGLNSDKSTKKLKGDHRPINNEESRAIILASLSFVSAIIIFDEQTPYNLINLVQPDVLFKGSDYRVEDIVGYDIVTAKGGEVQTIEFLPGYSTTDIEKKIRSG